MFKGRPTHQMKNGGTTGCLARSKRVKLLAVSASARKASIDWGTAASSVGLQRRFATSLQKSSEVKAGGRFQSTLTGLDNISSAIGLGMDFRVCTLYNITYIASKFWICPFGACKLALKGFPGVPPENSHQKQTPQKRGSKSLGLWSLRNMIRVRPSFDSCRMYSFLFASL